MVDGRINFNPGHQLRWNSIQSLLAGSTRTAVAKSQPEDPSVPLLPRWEVGPDGSGVLRIPEAVVRSMQLTSEVAKTTTGDPVSE